MLESFRSQRKLQGLIGDWQVFRDAVLRTDKATAITPEEENRFLKIKARIAVQLPLLTGNVPRTLAKEAGDHAQQMTHLLNRYEKLSSEQLKLEEEREKFDHFWHQTYVFLNKLKGVGLAGERPMPRKGPATTAGVPGKKPRRAIPGTWLFKFVIRLGLIVLAIFLLGRGFGVRWDETGKFVAEPPGGIKEFLATVAGVLSGIGNSIWGWLTSFLQPVSNVYGPEVTIVLILVLLLALGYWFFVRGR
jgi:hypothetical protein